MIRAAFSNPAVLGTQGGAARLICTVVDCVPLDFAALDWALLHVVRLDRDELHIVSGLGTQAPVRQAFQLTRRCCAQTHSLHMTAHEKTCDGCALPVIAVPTSTDGDNLHVLDLNETFNNEDTLHALQGVDKQQLAMMAGYVAPPTLEPQVADMCTEEVMAAALLAGVPRDRAFFTSRPRDANDIVAYCKFHKVCTCRSSRCAGHSVTVTQRDHHRHKDEVLFLPLVQVDMLVMNARGRQQARLRPRNDDVLTCSLHAPCPVITVAQEQGL